MILSSFPPISCRTRAIELIIYGFLTFGLPFSTKHAISHALMKILRPLSLILALSLATISIAPAVAADPTATTTPAPATNGKHHSTETIKAVDATANTFTLSTKTVHATYTLTADAVITKLDKTPGTIADLTVGTRVTVFYNVVDANNRSAYKVNILPPSTASHHSHTPTPAPATQVAAPTPAQ